MARSCPKCSYPVLAHHEWCLHCNLHLCPSSDARDTWSQLPVAVREKAEDDLLRQHGDLDAGAAPWLWLRHALLGLGAMVILCLISLGVSPKDFSKLILSAVVVGPALGLVLHWLRGGPYKGALVFGVSYFVWGYAASVWDLPFPAFLYVGIFMFPCVGVILGIIVERAFRQTFGI